jgi:hypothetical protein
VTLKPIQGAPIGARIPDFPTGKPESVAVPTSGSRRGPVEPLEFSRPLPAPAVPPLPARRPGPVEIRGSDNSTLTFRSIPEIPAINRSSMIISITCEPTGSCSLRRTLHLHLTTGEAGAFLRALGDGNSPIVAADSRSGLQIEFAMAEDGPAFTVSEPGLASTSRRFNAGLSFDVKRMAAHLLTALGAEAESGGMPRSRSAG